MPPVPHGAAGAGRQVGGSADGRALRAWVDAVGALSVTLATPLNGKKVRGYGFDGHRGWPCAPVARSAAAKAGRKKGARPPPQRGAGRAWML